MKRVILILATLYFVFMTCFMIGMVYDEVDGLVRHLDITESMGMTCSMDALVLLAGSLLASLGGAIGFWLCLVEPTREPGRHNARVVGHPISMEIVYN